MNVYYSDIYIFDNEDPELPASTHSLYEEITLRIYIVHIFTTWFVGRSFPVIYTDGRMNMLIELKKSRLPKVNVYVDFEPLDSNEIGQLNKVWKLVIGSGFF